MSVLSDLGAIVHEPFEETDEGAKTAETQGKGWAYRVAQADVQVIWKAATLPYINSYLQSLRRLGIVKPFLQS